MLAKRIIPCLDVKDGRVVKGVNFVTLQDTGDPVELAQFYNDEGADELVFLDITATSENRKTMMPVIKLIAQQIFIPFTVGGGITTTDDIRETLRAGADKVSLNSIAINNPKLITQAAQCFGTQCIVLAIDAKKQDNTWKVFINGGRTPTGLNALDWAKEGVRRGAGEILLTSIDKDGTKLGYDLELTQTISEAVNIPVIASGGAGSMKDFVEVFKKGKADAALAASIFHFGSFRICDLKKMLQLSGIPTRE